MSTTNPAPATATTTPAPATETTAAASSATTASAPTSTHRRRSSILSEEQQAYLERRLANRPDVDTLQQAGIIKQGGRFAAQQAALQRELHQDALARSLDQRPPIDNLIQAGIVEQGSVAPGLQAVAKKLERNLIANNLNQKLYARDHPDVLAQQHSTLFRGDNVAPRLRDAKIRLEHALTRDHVGHLLESRPDPYDLVRSNVAPPTHVAPRIAGVQRTLHHHMTTDRVGHLLERRASLDALQSHNILKDVRVAPALQGPQRALERNLAKANLYHALQHRPTISDLKQRGVYPDGYEPYYEDEPQQHQTRSYAHSTSSYEPSGYQRRSKNFHLTRILLKFVATMAEAGEISLQQKGYLKDLIVDQDKTILAVAETFDAENDLHDFKDSLVRLASRR